MKNYRTMRLRSKNMIYLLVILNLASCSDKISTGAIIPEPAGSSTILIPCEKKIGDRYFFKNGEYEVELSYESRSCFFYVKKMTLKIGDDRMVVGSSAFKTDRPQELFFPTKIDSANIRIESTDNMKAVMINGGDAAGLFSIRFEIENGMLMKRIIVSKDRREPLVTGGQ